MSDGEDSTSDEELLEVRRCSKRLRNKFGLGFPAQDNIKVEFPSTSTLFNKYNPQPTKEGYESVYESNEEQENPIPSDVDDIFQYKEHKKKMGLIEYDPSCDHKQLEFVIGMKFTRPQQFREVVQMYAVENGRNIRWKRSYALKMEARCVAGCYWKVYASWLQERVSFVIKSVYPIHKCRRCLTNKQATAKWIGTIYLTKFRNNPTWSVSEMKDALKERFGLIIRSMCYKARVKALHILRGTLEEHYAKLRSYVLELKRVDREGTFVCEVHPDSNCVFWRLYVGFFAMRKNYLAVGKPVFGLDDAFLKTMLTVVGKDSNNQMYPLAWAVVDSENEENWRWFMGLFIIDYDIIYGFRWPVISNQQKVMKYGLNLFVFNLLYCY